MDLARFDGTCVRIITVSGEVYEGVVSFDSREYSLHEYGRDQEALRLHPIVFYEDDIARVVSLDDVDGPFGQYSEAYGLLERTCLEWGTDLIEEVLDSGNEVQALRMLACMSDNVQSLVDRAVPGMAPWRSGTSISESEDGRSEQGPVYVGELERMLNTLVEHDENEEVVEKARALLEQFAALAS